jgi:hypothetical protein
MVMVMISGIRALGGTKVFMSKGLAKQGRAERRHSGQSASRQQSGCGATTGRAGSRKQRPGGGCVGPRTRGGCRDSNARKLF